MKTLRLTTLLMGACLLFSGCPFGHDPIGFGLTLSFQDTSGKDLVEGIEHDSLSWEVDRALYGLSIFINGTKPYQGVTYRPDPLSIHYAPSYADSTIPYSTLFVGFAERKSKITFTALLFCPYIFGDNTRHEITAYLKKKGGAYVHTRLTFDGKDIDITKQEHGNAYAMIVLD